MKSKLAFGCLFVSIFVGLNSQLQARPEDPDTTFSGDGLAVTMADIDTAASSTDVAVDSLGRVVVIATVVRPGPIGPTKDILVTRYLANGDLDSNFGGGGYVIVDLESRGLDDDASSVAIDSSDRIIVSGAIYPESRIRDIVVCRLTEGGAIDGSFNSAHSHPGFFRFDTFIGGVSYTDVPTCLEIDSVGRILVGGHSFVPGQSNNFRVIRLMNSGVPDSGFGTGGVAGGMSGIDGGTNGMLSELLTGIAVRSSGEIFVSYFSGFSPGVARLTSAGVLDVGWANHFVLPIQGDAGMTTSIQVDANGQPVVCGIRFVNGLAKMFVARLSQSGAAVDWIQNEDFGATNERATGVSIQRDGKIVVVGTSNGGPGIVVARYNSNGTRDTTFNGGLGGFAKNVTGLMGEGSTSVAVDRDGGIVVGGSTRTLVFAYVLVGEPGEYWYNLANSYYAYYSGLGQGREALAFWFYFRAYGDLARFDNIGDAASAYKEFYQGLAFFYYTYLEGQPGRLYYYYLYLGYSEYTSRLVSGDPVGASAYYNYYVELANSSL